MTDSCVAPNGGLKRGLKNTVLGDAAAVVSASLATTKRLRSSTVADLPCQVCGKLSKSPVVTRANPALQGHDDPTELNALGKTSGSLIPPRGGVVVCEACKKFCSRFSARISSNSAENKEWMTKCCCRKNEENEASILDHHLADICRWCRYRRCHALGLVVDSSVKESLKGPLDLHSVPCVVCSAPSSGYHFGVLSCEGCKGFFRRTLNHQLELSYVCEASSTQPCDVTQPNGRRCKKCRYTKCVAQGMSQAAIRTGRHSYQLRAETKARLEQLHYSENSNEHGSSSHSTTDEPKESSAVLSPMTSQTSGTQASPPSVLETADVQLNDLSFDVFQFDNAVPRTYAGLANNGFNDFNVYDEEVQPKQPSPVSALAAVPNNDTAAWPAAASSSFNGYLGERVLPSPFSGQASSPADSELFQPLCSSPDASMGSTGNDSPSSESVQDAITKMRQPCEKSPYVWLYDSAREYVDLRQPNPRPSYTNSLSKHGHDIDPLSLLDDYFFVTPIKIESLTTGQMPMIDVNRAQWLIRRVVQSSRLIGNITTVRTIISPNMSAVDVFKAMSDHFDTFSRFVLQFIRSLPGFDSICLSDRTRLFLHSMFPLLTAQMSLDYDEINRTPNICGLEPGPGRQLAFNYFHHLGMLEPSARDAGMSIKQARLCVIEFAMICGLLYFNPEVPDLSEPKRVERVAEEYKRAAEIFIGRNFATNGSTSASSRIDMFFSQLSYFKSFYRFYSWMLCDFGRHYPSFIGMDPWLSELHSRILQLSEKNPEINSSQQSTVYPPNLNPIHAC